MCCDGAFCHARIAAAVDTSSAKHAALVARSIALYKRSMDRRLAWIALAISCGISAVATAEPRRGDRVVVPVGTSILGSLHDQSSDRPIGTVVLKRAWVVSEIDGGRVLLERRARGMVERIVVTEDSLGTGPVDRASELGFVAATVEDCRERGRCNFALAKGRRFDAVFAEHSVVEAKRRILFDRPVKACVLGPIVKLMPDADDPAWLSPASTAWRPTSGHQYELAETVELLAGTKPVTPPACPDVQKPNPDKAIVGGKRADRPQMGLFALAAKDVDALLKIEGYEPRYELAMKLANRTWVGDRTMCEDAVDQAIGFPALPVTLDAGERRTWRTISRAAAKRRHWGEVLLRHARMFNEYEPEPCERSFEQLLEGLAHAARTGDVLWRFGY